MAWSIFVVSTINLLILIVLFLLIVSLDESTGKKLSTAFMVVVSAGLMFYISYVHGNTLKRLRDLENKLEGGQIEGN